ncbi:MAG: Glycogen synthase [Microgenomates group bacterium GW2011_GWF2_45_18]|nr:MAG: Glycogen synthase [Microgenomates group bacterium GW2011_GWF1_44_10]KKU01497.1 MAG: Glycogen synthase [Microgenomates group bacterium GW2011_GWF2_45_18]
MNTSHPLRVAHITSEIYPFSKTGGLGHAVADLSTHIADANVDVTVFTPLYGCVSKHLKNKLIETVLIDIPVKLDRSTSLTCSCVKYLQTTPLGNTITFYFVNHFDFFGRYSRNLYLHKDTPRRFLFFTRAVLEIMKTLQLQFDIMHCHDWMTGLFPQLAHEYLTKPQLKRMKTVLTIHNLAFQGSDQINLARLSSLKQRAPVVHFPEFWDNHKWDRVNFLRQGIKYAHIITTVSPTYAKEILSKYHGEGLSRYLNKHKPIYGIVNGINYALYNPLNSDRIAQNYSSLNVSVGKQKNKERLLKKLSFPDTYASWPMAFTNHRLTHQKRFDVLIASMKSLLKQHLILIIAGEGDKRYHDAFNMLEEKYPNFRFITPISDAFEQKLLAGGDIVLCPSVFEPCGTAHMKAMRYGVLPVARNTGGLADTIFNYDKSNTSGTGFLFKNNSSVSFLSTMRIALNLYINNRERWNNLVIKCMNQSFDWDKSTQEYIAIYESLFEKKKIIDVSYSVGVGGLEPPTSRSQTVHSTN